MADVLIRLWQWGAPLEPLGDEAPVIQRDLAARMVRLSQLHEALRGVKIETNVDSMTHVRASHVHAAHNFQFVLNREMVSYSYEPPRGASPQSLAAHLKSAAEPVLGAVTSSTWFQTRVRRSHYFYSIEVKLSRVGPGGAFAHLVRTHAPSFEHPDQTALAALRPVMRDAPHQFAIRTTVKARAAKTSFDLSIEILADRKQPSMLRASVILLSPDKQRATAPWLGNVGALHTAVWPAIERFFDEVEERRAQRESNKAGAKGEVSGKGKEGSRGKIRRKSRIDRKQAQR